MSSLVQIPLMDSRMPTDGIESISEWARQELSKEIKVLHIWCLGRKYFDKIAVILSNIPIFSP